MEKGQQFDQMITSLSHARINEKSRDEDRPQEKLYELREAEQRLKKSIPKGEEMLPETKALFDSSSKLASEMLKDNAVLGKVQEDANQENYERSLKMFISALDQRFMTFWYKSGYLHKHSDFCINQVDVQGYPAVVVQIIFNKPLKRVSSFPDDLKRGISAFLLDMERSQPKPLDLAVYWEGVNKKGKSFETVIPRTRGNF